MVKVIVSALLSILTRRVLDDEIGRRLKLFGNRDKGCHFFKYGFVRNLLSRGVASFSVYTSLSGMAFVCMHIHVYLFP